jgi:hypothetical protein
MKPGINPRLLKSEPMQRCHLDECRGACCLYGVWLDQNEWAEIQANAGLIIPHMPPGKDKPSEWVDEREDDDEFAPSGKVVHSRVLDDPNHYGGSACVFLRSDHKCALQVAGQAAGMHPWHFKPFYCILHPLDLDEQGCITLDETEAMLSEAGSCLRASQRFVPLIETFEPELRYILGEEKYNEITRGTNKTTDPLS